MSKANESAFPTNVHKSQRESCGLDLGLTKRELLAAMILAGNCANPDFTGHKAPSLVEQSIEMADALLAELEKSNENP